MAGDWSRKQLKKLLSNIKEISSIMFSYKHIKNPDGSESVEREVILLSKELGLKNWDETINRKIEDDVLGRWRDDQSKLIWKLARDLLVAEKRLQDADAPKDTDMPEAWVDRVVEAEKLLVKHNVLSLYPIEVLSDLSEGEVDFGTLKKTVKDEDDDPYQNPMAETDED